MELLNAVRVTMNTVEALLLPNYECNIQLVDIRAISIVILALIVALILVEILA